MWESLKPLYYIVLVVLGFHFLCLPHAHAGSRHQPILRDEIYFGSKLSNLAVLARRSDEYKKELDAQPDLIYAADAVWLEAQNPRSRRSILDVTQFSRRTSYSQVLIEIQTSPSTLLAHTIYRQETFRHFVTQFSPDFWVREGVSEAFFEQHPMQEACARAPNFMLMLTALPTTTYLQLRQSAKQQIDNILLTLAELGDPVATGIVNCTTFPNNTFQRRQQLGKAFHRCLLKQEPPPQMKLLPWEQAEFERLLDTIRPRLGSMPLFQKERHINKHLL